MFSIHGKKGSKRHKVFEAFKKAKKGLLLCTDVMARGKFNLFTISTLILTLRRLKSRVLLLLVVFSRYVLFQISPFCSALCYFDGILIKKNSKMHKMFEAFIKA